MPTDTQRQSAIDRFWSKVDKSGDCWLWTGQMSQDGYGRIKAFGIHYRAHRFIWEMLNGNPENLQVLHSCDNRRCVKPDHLHAGTHKENMLEMRLRNRAARGSQNAMTKLTEEDVIAIRLSTEKQRDLARQYGVCQGAISHARLGKNWNHVSTKPMPYLPKFNQKENQSHAN